MTRRVAARPVRLSDEVRMPREAVSETFAILANRGKGKSNTATVLVEQLYGQGLPVVVLDVKGDWWGLRSSRSGTDRGLPFVIFGGDHGDVPLEPTAGELLADLLVDRWVPCVLDLSLMSKTRARSFTTDFAERLYRRNRTSLMVVVDEADVLIPQRASADTARLLGAMEDIAKRGRHRGLGLTVITQRPQEVHKSVLELCETVMLLGMTGTRSIKAVREWIEAKADEDNAEVIASLPSLEVGEAWVWSPAFLRVLVRTRFDLCATFDSHKTPEPGERVVAPKMTTEVDLKVLGEQIEATVQRAKDNDPKALQLQNRLLQSTVDELKRKVEELQTRPPAVEAPDPDPALQVIERMRALAHDLGVVLLPWQERVIGAAVKTDPARFGAGPSSSRLAERNQSAVAAGMPALSHVPQKAAAPPPRPREAVAQRQGSGADLGKAERAVLAVLATYGARTHNQIALQTGYSAKASTIGVVLSKLRKAGYATPSMPVEATKAGLDALGSYDPLPTGDALLQHWRATIGASRSRVLDELVRVYPGASSQEDMATATGYSPTASTIGVHMSKLRSLELVDGWALSRDFAEAVGL